MVAVDNMTSDIEDIANRISDIIMSPATISGLINGALTVPLDMGYLAWGYMDTDSRFAHQTQRFRMAEAIHNDILNYKHITNAVEIIFKELDKYASDPSKIMRIAVSFHRWSGASLPRNLLRSYG